MADFFYILIFYESPFRIKILKIEKSGNFQSLFEPELALLVGPQVVSSKEGGELYDKILYA